jgi:hypothetical protein
MAVTRMGFRRIKSSMHLAPEAVLAFTRHPRLPSACHRDQSRPEPEAHRRITFARPEAKAALTVGHEVEFT